MSKSKSSKSLKWMSIETAPTDGTVIIGGEVSEDGMNVVTCHTDGTFRPWFGLDRSKLDMEFTHWSPMP